MSCGLCPTCRRGFTANCDEYPVLSDYGMQPLSGVEYGGMLSDLVRVPHAAAMLTPLPDGLDPVAVASVPDNVADGYRSVAPHLAARPGADVLVACHGTPSIGLYAAQSALALGAGSVTVASDDDEVLGWPSASGATPGAPTSSSEPGRWPIVVDCGTRVEAFRWVIRATEPEGILHSVSYYGGQPDRGGAAGAALHARHPAPHRARPLRGAAPRGARARRRRPPASRAGHHVRHRLGGRPEGLPRTDREAVVSRHPTAAVTPAPTDRSGAAMTLLTYAVDRRRRHHHHGRRQGQRPVARHARRDAAPSTGPRPTAATAVVLAGRPGRFSGGFDLGVLSAGGPDAERMLLGGFLLAERILGSRPGRRRLHGPRRRHGLVPALRRRHRVGAAGDFRIQANEVRIGLTLPYAASRSCATASPRRPSTGPSAWRAVAPAEAVAAGFLDRVVEPDNLVPTAHSIASSLARLDPVAHAESKRRPPRHHARRAAPSDRHRQLAASPHRRRAWRQAFRRTVSDDYKALVGSHHGSAYL